MDAFASALGAVVRVFQRPLTLYGFTFSWWEVFLFTIVASIVAIIIGGIFGGR